MVAETLIWDISRCTWVENIKYLSLTDRTPCYGTPKPAYFRTFHPSAEMPSVIDPEFENFSEREKQSEQYRPYNWSIMKILVALRGDRLTLPEEMEKKRISQMHKD